MNIEAKFSLQKKSEKKKINQDAIAISPDERIFAIADGVSTAPFSQIWSNKVVEKFIEKLQPQVIVTHHGCDLNVDHQIVHQAVITACRPQPGYPVRRILSFEVSSATEWQSTTAGNTFVPNWFEDVSGTINRKLQALEVYFAEMRPWPHSRSS